MNGNPPPFPDPPPRPDPPEDAIPSGSEALVGRTLGDYRVLRRLGRGAMAEVYLAEQVSLERKVALKILEPDVAKEQSDIEESRKATDHLVLERWRKMAGLI